MPVTCDIMMYDYPCLLIFDPFLSIPLIHRLHRRVSSQSVAPAVRLCPSPLTRCQNRLADASRTKAMVIHLYELELLAVSTLPTRIRSSCESHLSHIESMPATVVLMSLLFYIHLLGPLSQVHMCFLPAYNVHVPQSLHHSHWLRSGRLIPERILQSEYVRLPVRYVSTL